MKNTKDKGRVSKKETFRYPSQCKQVFPGVNDIAMDLLGTGKGRTRLLLTVMNVDCDEVLLHVGADFRRENIEFPCMFVHFGEIVGNGSGWLSIGY